MENKLTKTLEDLSKLFGKDNPELYKELMTMKETHGNRYLSQATLKIDELKEIIETTLQLPKSEQEWLGYALIDGMFEHFIRRSIINKEGSCCSGDKTRFIKEQLLKAATTGKPQTLFSGDDTGERDYWSPSSWQDTEELIDAYDHWYQLKGE